MMRTSVLDANEVETRRAGLWGLADQAGVSGVNLLVGIILARGLGGSAKHMHSELRVQSQGSGARVDYQVEVEPDRWLPSSIGAPFMRHEMAEQFTALIHEMERRQGIARSR